MKISFSTSFLMFALIILISGYINYFLIYFGIMIVHELGHLLIISIYKYKINEIKIYPYGGVIDTDILFNIRSYKLFLISIAGIIAQIILFYLVPNSGTNNYMIFKMLNSSLIIYNLLPIYPLDGYKILMSLNENIFKYRITLIISFLISIIFTILFYNYTKNTIIFIILYVMNILYFLKYKYIYFKFLLERYLYKINYKKIKYVNNINSLYKCRNNYVIYDKIYLEEKEILEKYLCKSIDN